MSETLPKVTVVIASRESEDSIEKTLLSVLGQQYAHLNCIVVDGGSEDGTVDIIRKYESQLLWWISERDNGPFDAMDKGIEKAKELSAGSNDCHWFCFLKAGDIFANNDVIAKVFSQKYIDYEKARAIGSGKPSAVTPDDVPFAQSSTFVRADVCQFDKDYQFAADYALLYHIYYEYGADSIVNVDFPIAIHRQDDPWENFYSRYIKGEQIGIRADHISWHWLKEYLRWKLGWF